MSKHFLREFKRFNTEEKEKHKLLHERIEGAFEAQVAKDKKKVSDMKPV